MKFVLAPDSFKGCMTAQQAASAMAQGIKSVISNCQIIKVPMADGGEGTTQSLIDALHGHWVTVPTVDPLGSPIKASYGLVNHDRTAIIETAAASGIQFINSKTANPLKTSTYGTGLLVRNALQHHVNQIIMGLGGSATNDGGAGLADALGARFFNSNHQLIHPTGGNLNQIKQIDCSHLNLRLKNTLIKVASDVSNPLTGPRGASAVFGPQKGATPEMVKQLDRNLSHYAKIIKQNLKINVAHLHGAGAAGGLGAGLMAFTNCTFRSGIKIVMQLTHLKTKLNDADVVITGEGSIDSQTQYGKVPVGVSQLAKRVNPNCRVIALGGHIGTGIQILHQKGIDAILPIIPGAMNLKQAIQTGPENLKRVSANLARLLNKPTVEKQKIK